MSPLERASISLHSSEERCGRTDRGIVPPFGAAALIIVIPSAISLALIRFRGHETRGRDLRALETSTTRSTIS